MAEQKKQDTNQLLKVRREKLADLQANGKDPFQITKFDQTHHSLEVKNLYEAHEAEILKDHKTPDVEGLDEAQAREVLKQDYEERRKIMDANPIHVAIAGRMMFKRVMGKASFCNIQDLQGNIQVYVARDAIGEESYADFKKRLVRDYDYQLREGVSREHGVYLALTPPGRGKAIRTYRLSEGYMPADIDRRIASKTADRVPVKREKAEKRNTKLDWAMSRNYQFIPYKEMSEYQKAMVRQVLEARRLYQRTGTPLYIHERSVSILRKMKNETKQCGVYVKRRETRRVQKELIKTMQQRRKKQL